MKNIGQNLKIHFQLLLISLICNNVVAYNLIFDATETINSQGSIVNNNFVDIDLDGVPDSIQTTYIGDLSFASLQDILNFTTAFPNVVEVFGDVILLDTADGAVLATYPLNQITSIHGMLSLSGGQHMLDGFDQLEYAQQIDVRDLFDTSVGYFSSLQSCRKIILDGVGVITDSFNNLNNCDTIGINLYGEMPDDGVFVHYQAEPLQSNLGLGFETVLQNCFISVDSLKAFSAFSATINESFINTENCLQIYLNNVELSSGSLPIHQVVNLWTRGNCRIAQLLEGIEHARLIEIEATQPSYFLNELDSVQYLLFNILTNNTDLQLRSLSNANAFWLDAIECCGTFGSTIREQSPTVSVELNNINSINNFYIRNLEIDLFDTPFCYSLNQVYIADSSLFHHQVKLHNPLIDDLTIIGYKGFSLDFLEEVKTINSCTVGVSPHLSECSVFALCNLTETSANSINIFGNANGCSSIDEVFLSCSGIYPGPQLGSLCDDNNPCTVDDVLISECVCQGVIENQAFELETTITEGETYDFNGQSLTTAGTYESVLVNAAGCDSVVTLTLTVNPALTCEIRASATSICAGESVELSVDAGASNTSACASNQLPANLQNGLVAYYPFCGNANDASGNGNDGVVNGASLTSDRFGVFQSAYIFDGIDDQIVTTFNGVLNTSARTISFWAKTSNTAEQTPIIYGSNIQGQRFNATFNYARLGVTVGIANSAITYQSNSTVGDNEWHHYVFTLDELENPRIYDYKVYEDGVLLSTAVHLYNSNEAVNTQTGYPLTIGGVIFPAPYPETLFNGALDEIGIWNRAFTQNDVQNLFATQSVLWSNGATTPSITVSPTETTTYSVTVTQDGQTCTSDVTITVNQPSAEAIEATITEGETYEFNGQSLTTAGTYEAVLVNAAGCDSVVTLTLTVNPALSCGITASATSICAGESVELSVDGGASNTSACASNQLPANLQNGLVAYYPFCGNANDASGNGNDGILSANSPFLTADRFGNPENAYEFSTNQLISAPIVNTSVFTASAWVRFDSYDACTSSGVTGSYFISHKSNNSYGNGFGIGQVNGRFSWFNYNTSANDFQQYPQPVELDRWYFVAETFDNGGRAYLYIDGVVADSMIIGNVISGGNLYDFKIGGEIDNPTVCWFDGIIDDVCYYNRALAASEIQQLYYATAQIWSTGATTPSITVAPTETTTYSVTVTQDGQTCTSDVTITVNQPSLSSIEATITEGETYEFNGQSLAVAGTYEAVLENAVGCDSVVTLALAVNPISLLCEVMTNATSLCQGDSAQLEVITNGVSSIPTATCWQPVIAPQNQYLRILKANNGNYLVSTYQGSQAQLYTTNDPNVWSSGGNPLPTGLHLMSGKTYSGKLFISSSHNGVFVSTNNGSSWNYSFGNGFGCAALDFEESTPGTLFISLGGFLRGIYKSTDDGVNWLNTAGGLDFTDIEWVPGTSTLFAQNTNGQLWKSADKGSTWSAQSSAPFYGLAGKVESIGAAIWVFAIDGKVYRSLDLGVTWSLITTLPFTSNASVYCNDFVIDPQGTWWYGANSQGIWRSMDNGSSWTSADDCLAGEFRYFFLDGSDLLVTTNTSINRIGLNGANVQWSTGATTPSITVAPTETTTYSVTVTQDGQTCTSDVTITVLPTETFYADNDGDGFGDAGNSINACEGQPQGYVSDNTDCDDSNAAVYIGASCDDGDICTEGDVLRGDCTCAGTYADDDQDGTCNALDQCAFGPEPGTGCDDNNPCTINDSVQGDCTCAGETVQPETSLETIHACEPFSWNGQTYSQSGTYTFATTNALGCDSIATLELTIGAPSASNTAINACNAYTWNGQVYTQSGTYTYVTINASGCDSIATLELAIQNSSVAPTAINASAASVTVGGSVTLSVVGGTLGTGAQWKWYTQSCGGTLIGTGNSITATVYSTTTYFVRAEGDCNVTTCASVTITGNAIPCGPQSVSASALSVCYGSSTTLTVSGQLNAGASWKWYKNGCGLGTVVGSGSSLAVLPTATTTYFVRAEGGTCGITSCASVTITVNPAPAQPTFIQGPANGLCGLQNVSYSTPAVSGATSYVWTVPNGATIVSGQGTNAIVVNYGSTLGINTACGATAICVRSVNACGSSALRCVNLSLAPNTPGAITGQSIVCRTQSYTYSIAPVAGATSYTWTVPSTWQITSGQGTTSITVVAGTMNGEVRVLANNACGASKIARRSVTTFTCSSPGMTMLDEMPELAVWPNPANELVHIQVDQVIPDKVEIYDMLGKRMFEGMWTQEFDVTNWPSGVYVVRVSLGQEQLVQRLEITH